MPTRSLAAIAALTALAALAGCGDETSAPAGDGGDDGGSAAAGPACEYPADGQQPEVEPPPARATVSGEVEVTIATGVGDLHATLDADATPCTVGSFVSLAEQGYFDGTSCHRLTTAGIFVLQCGDPTGTGAGGPGYSFPDELTGDETYGAGTLAMANAGPDTNGSQFFIVYDDSTLDPAYTVFGTVDEESVALVQEVAAEGADDANGQGDGAPNRPVEIESVSVG